MSFRLKISAKDQATGRFKGRVNRELVKAVVKAKRDRNLTQIQIADKMGVDKSTVSRIMKGQGNLTLKTIGDICWALSLRPDMVFSEIQQEGTNRANHPAMRAVQQKSLDELPGSTSRNKATIISQPAMERPQTSSKANGNVFVAS